MLELSARRPANCRRPQIRATFLIAVLAVGMCLGAAIVRAYDTRLHEAVAALQKAAGLVEASSAGNVSAHTQHKFDNQRAKALSSIHEAMDHIVAAGLIADSDGGSE